MSSEEQACLVRARSDSDNSAGFGSIGRGMAYPEAGAEAAAGASGLMPHEASAGEAGELIDCQDLSVLAQFHEDAIRQAGFGRQQLLLCGVFGLALVSLGVEYTAVQYVGPSADVEFCMTARKRWWLSSITVLGIACGSAVWGNLSDRMGRRRTLLSCLGVNAVFGVIAAFMPTYGPFMMARFCSAIGIGGAPVSAAGALSEMSCGSSRRARVLAPLLACCGLGALLSAGMAVLTLPETGRDTVVENKEHFSAWHRYLLLCTLPTVAALAALVWAHESPRYLLECGREVEALMIYQRIYKKNRSRAGGAGGAGAGGYQLSELELPSKRPSHRLAPPPPARSVLADMANSVHQFWSCFLQLFSSPFARTTYMLAGALSATLFCQFAMSAYAPSLIVRNKNALFQASTRRITNQTYEFSAFNSSIENVVYEKCTFINCTFKDVTFSHVVFRSCQFYDVEFSNIMSSLTFFEKSLFQGSRFIDTDLNTARHMDAECRLINSTILGLSPACPLEADHNIYLIEAERVHACMAGATVIAFIIGAGILPIIGRVPTIVGSLALVSLSTPGLYFLESETSIVAYSSVFEGLLALAHFGLTVIIVESYPVHLRCTAHGFLFSIGHVTGLIAVGIYSNLTLNSYALATLMTGFIVITGTVFSTRLVDSSSNLM